MLMMMMLILMLLLTNPLCCRTNSHAICRNMLSCHSIHRLDHGFHLLLQTCHSCACTFRSVCSFSSVVHGARRPTTRRTWPRSGSPWPRSGSPCPWRSGCPVITFALMALALAVAFLTSPCTDMSRLSRRSRLDSFLLLAIGFAIICRLGHQLNIHAQGSRLSILLAQFVKT